LKLNYKQYGDSGKYVVIVHGLFGMLDNWHKMAKLLSPEYQVITLDVRNHGASPHNERMSYADICSDINELLIDLNISSAHFVGHSMGGKAVMKLADLHPELIDKLCVVDIAPKRYKPGHHEIFKAMFELPVSELTSRKDAENHLATRIKDAGIRLFILKNIDRKTEGGYQWKLGLQNIYSNYEQIIDSITLQWPYSKDVLFIKGEKSHYITNQDELDILDFFPNATFQSIPNSGHWVHAENPTAFYATLNEFLA
jgi:esterase